MIEVRGALRLRLEAKRIGNVEGGRKKDRRKTRSQQHQEKNQENPTSLGEAAML